MENNKNNASFLVTLLIVMSLALAVLVYLYFDMRAENRSTIQQLQDYSGIIEAKKDSLEHELNNIIVQYDSLKSDNDTINLQLEMQQVRIKKLLSLRVNDAQKIRAYEKELTTIREVLRSYIVQIDSLNTKNQILLVENKELKNSSAKLQNQNKQLSEEKDQLTSITKEAKTLIAAQIAVVPLNKRSKEQDKVNKIVKIRTDFTLRKNKVAEPGSRMIYLRLIRPDGVVLGSSESGVFDYQGEQLPFSAKREVNYENIDLPVSIFWDNNGDLVKGNYTCELFCDGSLIGNTEFTLR